MDSPFVRFTRRMVGPRRGSRAHRPGRIVPPRRWPNETRPARSGDAPPDARWQNRGMDTHMLSTLSTQMADVVAAVEPSVVQVRAGRRPVSGIAYDRHIVLTSGRALGREEGLQIARGDTTAAAELVGWDPASGLAVLRAEGLNLTPAPVADAAPRVGEIVLPIARSWSNALTASAGIVAVIGGPLR